MPPMAASEPAADPSDDDADAAPRPPAFAQETVVAGTTGQGGGKDVAEKKQRRLGPFVMGGRLGVEGTPSLFINGRRFDESTTSLAAYIREELDQ